MMSEELRFFGGSGQTAKETIETIGEIKRKNSPATLTIDAAGCRKPIPKQPPKCLNNPDGMPPSGLLRIWRNCNILSLPVWSRTT
jgi:hypothetical protein